MEVLTSVDEARIGELRERDEFFWIDLVAPTDDELATLGRVLDLHPLAIEDTREMHQRPKVERYGDRILVVFYTARLPTGGEPELLEVHLHISGQYLATVRARGCDALDGLRPKLIDEHTEKEDYLVYRILDALTDALYPVVDHFERRIDELETAVLDAPNRALLGAINDRREIVQRFARRIAAQRDHFVTAGMELADLPGLTRSRREYMRDVGDHLTQIASELHRQAEDVTTVTTMYFNSNANRLTLTATRLTVIATFFLVWTLVTSFFGQNFKWMTDHVESLWAFIAFGIGGLVIPTAVTGIYFWRRRREWL